MLIRLGVALDGYEPRQPGAAAGEWTTGPAGLLDALETRLGLWAERPPRVVRVAQYERCLASCDHGGRFYSSSFETDPFGVAETLLGWRDQWVAGGWDGGGAAADGRRLSDLADVERVAREILAPGVSDRLRAVTAALAAGRRSGIGRVELLDPVEDLPVGWGRVLSLLDAATVSRADLPPPAAPAGTDLAALQAALLRNSPARFGGDGSFLVVAADSDQVLARGLASCFATSAGWRLPDTTLVVGPAEGALNLELRAAGLPTAGFAEKSPWRPGSQVLRLALSLLWKPLDPTRLFELLTLPASPIADPLRSRLAGIVAEAPGIGGDRWREAVAQWRADKEPGASQALADGEDPVAAWLEGPRFDEAAGAPVQTVRAVCERVARWASDRARDEGATESERQTFRAAESEAAALCDAIDQRSASGHALVGRAQLERLVDAVTADGSAPSDATSECGGARAVRDPAAVVEPVPRVLWWGFVAPPMPSPLPWSAAEVQRLKARGVEVRSPASELRAAARAWLRPVLAARAQLVLVRPRRVEREATAHPLWDQIVGLAVAQSVPTLDIDAVLRGEVRPPAGLPLRLGAVAHRPLPAARRWWRLRDGEALGPRAAESYSSLDKLLRAPHQWVLRYKARLLPGVVATWQDRSRLLGTILHQLFERLFAADDLDWRTADEPTVGGWVAHRLPRLLAEEGATLLLPGARREAEALQATARRAAWALIRQLRGAGVTAVRVEVPGRVPFWGGILTGQIDLLARRSDGREAVVDLKSSGFKYRCDELRRNEQLQLAVYAALRRDAAAAPPAEAYFVLDEARLAAQSDDYFPRAWVCAPAGGAGTPALWGAVEATWAWRRGQLDRGLIEVNVSATEPDEASLPPAGGLGIAAANDDFDDYARLAGWPRGA